MKPDVAVALAVPTAESVAWQPLAEVPAVQYAIAAPHESSSIWTITSGVPSPAQSLNVGSNSLLVTVFSNSAKIYEVVVTREQAAAPILTGLTLSVGTLSPLFDGMTKNYTATVPYDTLGVTVTATAPAGMYMNLGGEALTSGQPSSEQDLNVGANDLRLTVISGAGGTVYSILVTRQSPAAPTLTNLVLSEGTLTPTFDAATRGYTSAVAYDVSSVTVTATAPPGTTLGLNGAQLTSGVPSTPQDLSEGENSLVVALFASTASTYTVVVSRASAPMPILTDLQLSTGTLSPTFDSGTKNYAASVPYATLGVTVTATAPAGMFMNLDGEALASGVPSSEQNLTVGTNALRLTVISGTSGSVYNVVVTREAAPAPVLTGLTISEGTLTPVFSGATQLYTATVPNSTTSLTVTASAATGTFITLNGAAITSGQPSPPQALAVGENGLEITLFTESATLYYVVVTRAGIVPMITELKVEDGNAVVTWTGAGTLQSSTNLVPPSWTSIPSSGNTHSNSISGVPLLYYRIAQ